MIYQNIKSIASSKKIPISKIEKDCGITPKYICTWDDVTPNVMLVAKVANYLETTVEELIKELTTREEII